MSVTACYSFSKADWDSICNYLYSENSQAELKSCITASCMWDKFIAILTAGFELYITKTTVVKRRAARPYYPKSVRNFQSKTLQVWRLLCKFRTPELAHKYNYLAQKCSNATKKLSSPAGLQTH